MNRTTFSLLAVVLGSTIATNARAQDAKMGVAPASSTSASPVASRAEDDAPDHERFVGHFAVGYFGISQIPIALANAGADLPGAYSATNPGTVTAPIVGIRYWLRRGFGIDAGVGFGFQGGGTTTTTRTANGTTSATNSNTNNATAFALHAGVPFALAEGHHYVFEFVPETTFGYAGGSVNGANGSIGLNGVRFDLGARIGAELHFGFIGVPELALQASVGLYFEYLGTSANQGPNSVSWNKPTLGTTVNGDPWAIFADTISALYYF
jgi:hypothetical protein